MSAALAPWTRYIDRLPEPHRSLFIYEFKRYLVRVFDIASMVDRDGYPLTQRRRRRP